MAEATSETFMDGDLAYYKQRAEALLPPESDVVARNRAITATYAELYRGRRSLFKWSGMAAFASHRVGIALLPFEVSSWLGHAAHFVPRHPKLATLDDVDEDLNLLRVTNNRVYESSAWAHLAFDELRDDGARVLDLSATQAELRLFRSGFERLGRASRRLRQGEPLRVVLPEIWRGNTEILRFEQEVTVQAGFERFRPTFRTFLTWAMSMEFDGDNRKIELDTLSYFPSFMWTSGLSVLAKTRSVPRVYHLEHRWHWIEHRLLPLWKRVDAEPDVEAKMLRLQALKDPSLALTRRVLAPPLREAIRADLRVSRGRASAAYSSRVGTRRP
jgi:hypothetical protein